MITETTWQHNWPGPVWLAVLLAAVVAAWTAAVYRSEPHVPGRRLRGLLAVLRVAALWLAVWMMFGWSRQEHQTEPAELIVALDDSASMGFLHDAWTPREAARLQRVVSPTGPAGLARFDIARGLLASARTRWLDALRKTYQVRLFLLAESVREIPAEQLDDLNQLEPVRPSSALGTGLQHLLEAQKGRPTAAIVVLTDGVTTSGPSVADLALTARQYAIPLFAVGIGSDQPVRDIRLADVLVDDVAFVEDVVTLSCQVQATGFSGRQTVVRLSRSDTNETLDEQKVELPAGAERTPLSLSFRARTPGEYPLLLETPPLEGEADVENNRSSHRLYVHDSTIRVLLVQAAPSYEFRYLANLLGRAMKPGGDGSEKAFSVATVLQEAEREWVEQDPLAIAGFPLQRQELFDYDVVILGDADPAFLGTGAMANLVEFVREQAGGVIFSSGPSFLPMAYRGTPVAALFPFDIDTVTVPGGAPLEESFPVRLTAIGQRMPPCQLVSSPADNARLWTQLPGLYWNVDIPDPSPASRVLLERGGDGGGTRSLVLLQYFGAGRVVFHATDETYRWARHEGNDEYYERYWLQMIRYASRSKLLRDRSPAAISVDKEHFAYGEAVPIRVRFHQAGLAPQPPNPVTLVLEPARGTRQDLTLQVDPENPAVFAGAASGLAPGRYRVWLSSPSLALPPAPAEFEVAVPATEQVSRPMNASDLERAARISGGRFFTVEDAERLPSQLPRGQRVRIESLPREPWWNSPWVAATFIALLSTEWFLRKRAGLL